MDRMQQILDELDKLNNKVSVRRQPDTKERLKQVIET
jgi:hypothetical protein